MSAQLEAAWRVEVLTPLHVGAGEALMIKGVHAASAFGWTYALDLDHLCAAVPAAQWDHLAAEGFAAVYADQPLRAVARYAVRGEVRGPAGLARVRPFARDGFGRPYLPGSTLKGALRTALLAQRAADDEGVRGALRAAAAERRPDAALPAEQAALRLRCGEAIDDALRHLHVSDVFVPPGSI